MKEKVALSKRLRAVSFGGHRQPEPEETDGRYGERYLHGGLSNEQVAAQAGQHYFMYSALEDGVRRLAEREPEFPFRFPELDRVPALERDLEYWLGSDWRDRIEATPALQEYVDRIRGVSDSVHLFIAHHYTRYLADLSGGQMIAKMHESAYGLQDHQGAEFYHFPEIDDIPAFKDAYRETLDAYSFSDEEIREIEEEVRRAYDWNNAAARELNRVL